MTKINQQLNQQTNQQVNQQTNLHQHKGNYEQLAMVSTMLAVTLAFIPELAFAAGGDAFATIYTKVNGWVGGSAGKLITISALIISGLMGVIGFPLKYILGAIGTGLLLSSASALVEMIF